MGRPRSRFTVRGMMVAVAISALVVAGETWRRRCHYCRLNVERCILSEKAHSWMAESHRKVSALYRSRAIGLGAQGHPDNLQSALFTLAAWEERARAKQAAGRAEDFRRAALRPWLPLPAPEPEPRGKPPVGPLARPEG